MTKDSTRKTIIPTVGIIVSDVSDENDQYFEDQMISALWSQCANTSAPKGVLEPSESRLNIYNERTLQILIKPCSKVWSNCLVRLQTGESSIL